MRQNREGLIPIAVNEYRSDAMNDIRGPAGVRRACTHLRSAKTRIELAATLYQEVSRYSLFDLQAMRGRIERDLQSVPTVPAAPLPADDGDDL